MRRDMDLVREILLLMENQDESAGEILISPGGYPQAVVQYHLGLLCEAGLIKAIDASSLDGDCFLPERLTWGGHEFLDAARSETLWNKVKGKIGPSVGSVGLDLMKELLVLAAKDALGLKG